MLLRRGIIILIKETAEINMAGRKMNFISGTGRKVNFISGTGRRVNFISGTGRRVNFSHVPVDL